MKRDRMNRLFVNLVQILCIACWLTLALQIAGVVHVTTHSLSTPTAD